VRGVTTTDARCITVAPGHGRTISRVGPEEHSGRRREEIRVYACVQRDAHDGQLFGTTTVTARRSENDIRVYIRKRSRNRRSVVPVCGAADETSRWKSLRSCCVRRRYGRFICFRCCCRTRDNNNCTPAFPIYIYLELYIYAVVVFRVK